MVVPWFERFARAAPQLKRAAEQMASHGVGGLDDAYFEGISAKQINDPIWGIITLNRWEVALLDTPLLQRLRGVRQLGLAHLVLPSAVHDRFSHSCGVVEAADRIMDAIERSRKARPEAVNSPPVSEISHGERKIVRFAALLHDIGHGSFSHPLEPIVRARLDGELERFNVELSKNFPQAKLASISEAMAMLIVISRPFAAFLERSIFSPLKENGLSVDELVERLVSAIAGNVDLTKPSSDLNALVSSQIDADKLDYMMRDAHHAGLPIDFDTPRLISKIERFRVLSTLVSKSLSVALKERFEKCSNVGGFNAIGLSASGTGAFEQMLVGRILLYDRLYHHHKVRAADAMAQRLVHYAVGGLVDGRRRKGDDEAEAVEPPSYQRSLPFDLLYGAWPDDTVVAMLGGLIPCADGSYYPVEVQTALNGDGSSKPSRPTTGPAHEIAQAILYRRLYKRAFAFSGRFLRVRDELDEENFEAEAGRTMAAVNTALCQIEVCLQEEEAIAAIARKISSLAPMGHALSEQGRDIASHHIIVDFPKNPHPAKIETLTRSFDDHIDTPDVFYNPSRWSDVYAIQRQTGFIFGDPRRLDLIAIAAHVWFLRRFQAVMDLGSDRHAKAGRLIQALTWADLLEWGAITEDEASCLKERKILFQVPSIKWQTVPAEWMRAKPSFLSEFNRELAAALPKGVSAKRNEDLDLALRVMFGALHAWMSGDYVRRELKSEAEFQERLIDLLKANGSRRPVINSKIAGGILDILLFDRVIIENKWHSKPLKNPLEILSEKAALQARKYALPLNENFVITAHAYRSLDTNGDLAPTESVQCVRIPGLEREFAEIRFVFRYGDPCPSRTTAPQDEDEKRPVQPPSGSPDGARRRSRRGKTS